MKNFTEKGRIKLGFASKTLEEITERKDSVLLGMTGNAFFPETVKDVNELQKQSDEFDNLNDQIAARNYSLVARRDAVWSLIVKSLETIGLAVTISAQGNVEQLVSSGYELYKTRTPAPKITVPEKLKVVNAAQPGAFVASVAAVTSAHGYLFKWKPSESGPQGAWEGLQTGYVTHTITGLTAGTSYDVKVGAVDKKGNVLFTDPVSRIAF